MQGPNHGRGSGSSVELGLASLIVPKVLTCPPTAALEPPRVARMRKVGRVTGEDWILGRCRRHPCAPEPAYTPRYVLCAQEDCGRETRGVRGFSTAQRVVVAPATPSGSFLALGTAELLTNAPDSQGLWEPGRLLKYSPRCFLNLTSQ